MDLLDYSGSNSDSDNDSDDDLREMKSKLQDSTGLDKGTSASIQKYPIGTENQDAGHDTAKPADDHTYSDNISDCISDEDDYMCPSTTESSVHENNKLVENNDNNFLNNFDMSNNSSNLYKISNENNKKNTETYQDNSESNTNEKEEFLKEKYNNFFSETIDDADDEMSSGEEIVEIEDQKISTTDRNACLTEVQSKLPGFTDLDPGSTECSVFTTSYHRAENEKRKVLEHHVKLTEISASSSATSGSSLKRIPVCRKFLQGSCTRGSRCPFSHSEEARDRQRKAVGVDARTGESTGVQGDGKKMKPGHAGLSQGLQPAKRSASALHAQRCAEQPWTVNKHARKK